MRSPVQSAGRLKSRCFADDITTPNLGQATATVADGTASAIVHLTGQTATDYTTMNYGIRALDGGAGRLGGGVEGGAGGQLVFLDHGRILDVGEEGLGRSEDRDQEATEEDREAETGHGGPDSGMRAA